MTDSTLVLYGFGVNDRSGKVRWLAHELGLDVEEKRLGFGDHRGPDYTVLNPYGAVPAVEYKGKLMTESTATSLYLAESVPESGLAVFAKDAERYEYLRWISLFSETFEGRLVDYLIAGFGLMPETVREIYREPLTRKLAALVKELPQQGFLVADRFTVADIVAAYSIRTAIASELLERDAVAGYLEPLMARPAAVNAEFFSSIATQE